MNNPMDLLPENARVWIYQSDRMLLPDEEEIVRRELSLFINDWNAHGSKLKAAFEVKYQLFLVLAVDEAVHSASGCSIDKSVSLIQSLSKRLGCDLLNRKVISYRTPDGKIGLEDINSFWAKRKAGIVTDNTIVFNNLVKNIGEFKASWEGPFSASWHAEMFS